MIAFVHGPDRMLARNAVVAEARKIDPDGSNTTWIDVAESGSSRVLDAVGAASFFGNPRVVIASGLVNRAARESKSAGSGATGGDAALKALLAAVPEENCLILFEPDLDAPPASIKSASRPVTILGGEPPRGSALLTWIGDAAERAGAHIDRDAAQLLAESLFAQTWERKPTNPRYDRPPDMALFSQEIEKLALAAYPGAISRDHVLALIPGSPDQGIFRFTDAAIAGDLRIAHAELARLMAGGEEPAMLLSHLLGQIELMAVASEGRAKDANSLARDLGSVTPARMSAVANSAQRRRLSAASSLDIGAAMDRQLKTGRFRRPDDALHHLIAAMAPDSTRGTGRSG